MRTEEKVLNALKNVREVGLASESERLASELAIEKAQTAIRAAQERALHARERKDAAIVEAERVLRAAGWADRTILFAGSAWSFKNGRLVAEPSTQFVVFHEEPAHAGS